MYLYIYLFSSVTCLHCWYTFDALVFFFSFFNLDNVILRPEWKVSLYRNGIVLRVSRRKKWQKKCFLRVLQTPWDPGWSNSQRSHQKIKRTLRRCQTMRQEREVMHFFFPSFYVTIGTVTHYRRKYTYTILLLYFSSLFTIYYNTNRRKTSDAKCGWKIYYCTKENRGSRIFGQASRFRIRAREIPSERAFSSKGPSGIRCAKAFVVPVSI